MSARFGVAGPSINSWVSFCQYHVGRGAVSTCERQAGMMSVECRSHLTGRDSVHRWHRSEAK